MKRCRSCKLEFDHTGASENTCCLVCLAWYKIGHHNDQYDFERIFKHELYIKIAHSLSDVNTTIDDTGIEVEICLGLLDEINACKEARSKV
jgi:hypothetical protein